MTRISLAALWADCTSAERRLLVATFAPWEWPRLLRMRARTAGLANRQCLTLEGERLAFARWLVEAGKIGEGEPCSRGSTCRPT